MSNRADLILYNAKVWTFDPRKPHAAAVGITGDRIIAVGSNCDVLSLKATGTEVIDCRGLPLIPGLNDAHCHILSTAASLSGFECGHGKLASIANLLSHLRAYAGGLEPGKWIRGYGLDPKALRESRYPTRHELDSAAPDHPVRLEHFSGHAAVLNSLALKLAEIDFSTPDPLDGLIEREAATGEPTGVLFEMGGFLRQRLGNTRSIIDLESGVIGLSDRLLKYGITSVQDAGPGNGMEQWRTFNSLSGNAKFAPRITMMAGAGNLEEFVEEGLAWGSGSKSLRLGHAKIMLTATTGSLYPAPEDLHWLCSKAVEAGFPVAVHAVEQEALDAVLDMLEFRLAPSVDSKRRSNLPVPRQRLEHCAECPPMLMRKLARSGVTVVTQPGFIYWRGDNYMERVDWELVPFLYDSTEMDRLGVPLAFGSDSPIIDPSPWKGIYSSVTSLTKTGKQFPRLSSDLDYGGQRPNSMTIGEALRTYSIGGAKAEGTEALKGIIRRGMLADLTLLDDIFDENTPETIEHTHAEMTIVGGEIKWAGVGVG